MGLTQSSKDVNPVVELDDDAMKRGVVASNPVLALWRTKTGKKVVRVITDLVLVGCVLALRVRRPPEP